MIDNTRLHQTGSTNFTEDTIHRFLLGRLRQSEQAIVEARLFEDGEFEAQVRLEELGLADDYARGRLTDTDRERFRSHFLVSADRRRTLTISNGLRARLASATLARDIPTTLKSWFRFGQPVWRYAFAALLLLLVLTIVWRGVKEPRLVDGIIPKGILPKPKPTATQKPEEANHPTATSPPVHDEPTPSLPDHEAVVATITLDSSSTVEHPATVAAPRADGGNARLQLLLPKIQTGTFQAELFGSTGESKFKSKSLAPTDGAKLNLDVPAQALRAGDYQIKLTNAGTSESVATYYLRVQ